MTIHVGCWTVASMDDDDGENGDIQFILYSRYINASWILFKGYKQKFIASQVKRN